MEASQGGGGGGSEREKSNSTTSSAAPIAAVATFWKDFDLEKERTILDEQGLRIAENQENSQKNRRKLAESTRDFKKASNEEKLNLFNSLLRGYQEEVDNLTKRAKFGENAFLNIYQKLYEAPDPYPVIASISEKDSKLSELESENRKMKVELEEFRMEATHLKNQQATIRRLEERCRQLEQQMEEKVKEIVEIKQRSLAEENQKTLEVLKGREQLLQDQLRQAQESVSNMQKLHELAQSQLFEVRAQSEEEGAAKQSEVNLLMDEVERAQARLLSLEREKGLLRSQLQSANEDNGDGKSDNLDGNSILENSLSAKVKLVSELNAELHNLENTLSNEREQHMSEMKKLNALLHEKDVSLEEMKKELQTRPTEKLVDDLRKKVKILQAVGYNSIEAEDWDAATTGEEMSKLESLLLDKNRKVEHELTQLKVKLSEKTSMLELAEAKTDALTAKVSEQQRLIQKLEDDILKGYSSREKKSTIFEEWDLSESGGTEQSGDAAQKRSPPDQDQSSMLKVICNQRDRFRARLRETEEEIRQLKEKIGILTTELEKSKADNVKLYEKIRFIQDYNSERVISRGSKKYAEDLESGFSSDVESKYKKLYEDDINPFAAFSKKEREQRYKELGLREKITLSSGRFLLGNKYARSFAFFYTIGLHILVFTCLYRMSALSHISNVPEDKMVNLPHP
ncbi:PREDICTED: protein CASP-like [Ipomoea nil]|uniref:protein CASP-like n=1 Tax=Ipomoea nil TaxID=35883 RepID=UPI000901577F|nr:PREDICTED: protein CASP-like [Ipomoea nil]